MATPTLGIPVGGYRKGVPWGGGGLKRCPTIGPSVILPRRATAAPATLLPAPQAARRTREGKAPAPIGPARDAQIGSGCFVIHHGRHYGPPTSCRLNGRRLTTKLMPASPSP